MLLDRGGDVAQQRVAGAMTVAVVDLFEPVDVDVGQYQMPIAVAGAVDLAPEQQQPDLAAKRAGELIQLRASEVIAPQAVILIGARSVSDRRRAVSGRMLTISGALVAVDGPLVGGRLVEVVVRRRLLSVDSGAVAILGCLVSIRRPLLGGRLRLITIRGIDMALSPRALAIIGGVITVSESAVSAARCPVTGRCRATETAARAMLLKRLALGCGVVDGAFGCVRVAARGGVLAIISRSAPPARLLISGRLGLVAF